MKAGRNNVLLKGRLFQPNHTTILYLILYQSRTLHLALQKASGKFSHKWIMMESPFKNIGQVITENGVLMLRRQQVAWG